VDGEAAARYIKSTNNKNTNTPIIAVSAYSGSEPNESNNLFVASLSKPLQKADLLSMPSSLHHCQCPDFRTAVLRQLGFKTTTMQGGPGATKVTAARAVQR
jgi:serine/threonine-protein kinase RIM15